MTDPRTPLRDDEVAAMLGLMAEEDAAALADRVRAADRPEDVAALAGLSPDEVRTLLAEIRAERVRVDPDGLRRRHRWITLALAGALACAAVAAFVPREALRAPLRASLEPKERPMPVFPDPFGTVGRIGRFVPSAGFDLPKGWSVTFDGVQGTFTLEGKGGTGDEEARLRRSVEYVRRVGETMNAGAFPWGPNDRPLRWVSVYGWNRRRITVRTPAGERVEWYDLGGGRP